MDGLMLLVGSPAIYSVGLWEQMMRIDALGGCNRWCNIDSDGFNYE